VLTKNMAFPTIPIFVLRFFQLLFLHPARFRADNTIIVASQFLNHRCPHELRVVGEENQQRKAIDMTMANGAIDIEV
jgi:hypothetical protein